MRTTRSSASHASEGLTGSSWPRYASLALDDHLREPDADARGSRTLIFTEVKRPTDGGVAVAETLTGAPAGQTTLAFLLRPATRRRRTYRHDGAGGSCSGADRRGGYGGIHGAAGVPC